MTPQVHTQQSHGHWSPSRGEMSGQRIWILKNKNPRLILSKQTYPQSKDGFAIFKYASLSIQCERVYTMHIHILYLVSFKSLWDVLSDFI